MGFSVNVRQSKTAIKVEVGDTILNAALKSGVQFPHGCQSGNCGACKSRLFSGDIQMSPYSEFALTKEEEESGLILACRSVPWSDCDLAYLEEDDLATFPIRELDCRVQKIEQYTHDIVRVCLDINSGGPFNFASGQYAKVSFDKFPSRDYSMANLPTDNFIEFHIRQISGGLTSTHANKKLVIGETVSLEGPFGVSYFRENHTGPLIAIGGGSGLAPINSIVETALEKNRKRPIHLYFGARDTRDVYLESHFSNLANNHENFTYTCVLSEPKEHTKYRTGHLFEAVSNDFNSLDGAKAYLAGPPIMVETCVKELCDLGIRQEDCHADAFYTEAEKVELEVRK